MHSQIQLIPGAIPELFATASENQVLTLGDRYGLMAALLTETLDEDEQSAIDRLLRAVLKGRVKVANL